MLEAVLKGLYFQQGTADDIQTVACNKMVANWTDGCNDFVHMYMSTVLFLTYNQFDGRGICTMMHSCEKKENGKLIDHLKSCNFSISSSRRNGHVREGYVGM